MVDTKYFRSKTKEVCPRAKQRSIKGCNTFKLFYVFYPLEIFDDRVVFVQ